MKHILQLHSCKILILIEFLRKTTKLCSPNSPVQIVCVHNGFILRLQWKLTVKTTQSYQQMGGLMVKTFANTMLASSAGPIWNAIWDMTCQACTSHQNRPWKKQAIG